jgi:hypothetical protein
LKKRIRIYTYTESTYGIWLSPRGEFKNLFRGMLNKKVMKKTGLVISAATGLVLIYCVVASVSENLALVFLLFIAALSMFFYMVIVILKDAPPSTKTFDQYFYDDADIMVQKTNLLEK